MTQPGLFDSMEAAEPVAPDRESSPDYPPIPTRPYQAIAAHNVWYSWTEEHAKSTLLVMPTGTGKTLTACAVAYDVLTKLGGDFLWVVHREELLDQALAAFRRWLPWASVGIEQGNEKSRIGVDAPRVVIASKDTLWKSERLQRLGRTRFAAAGVDECHHYRRDVKTYADIFNYFEGYQFGVTATPRPGNKYSLGYSFESLAYHYHILDAIHDGWLVPIRQEYAYVEGLDLSHISTTKSDLDNRQLAEEMQQEKPLYGLVTAASQYGNSCERRKSVLVFAASVEHARQCAEILNRWNAAQGTGAAASVDCKALDKEARKSLIGLFRSGPTELQYLANYGILTEGFDAPVVEVVVMGRPTKLESLYVQMAGRALRPLDEIVDALNAASSREERRAIIAASRKPYATLVDLVGVTGRHRLANVGAILAGKCPPTVINRAMKLLRSSNGGNVLDAVKLAQLEAEREAEQQQKTTRRRGVLVRANLRSQVIDPFDTRHKTGPRYQKKAQGQPVSEKMAAFLIRYGVDPNKVKSLTQGKAKRLSKLIADRRKANKCTYRQARTLSNFGYDANEMSFDEARKLLDALAKNGWNPL